MANDTEQTEPFAWVIGTGTWPDTVRRLLRRIPRPVFALGQNDLYSVVVHGGGFQLPIAGSEPAIGFFTTRIVAARGVRHAEELALSRVERDWRRRGRGPVALEVDQTCLLPERFRLRSGTGAAFYTQDDRV